jgi:hypothetical protein
MTHASTTVSIFPTVKATLPAETLPLAAVLQRVQDGTYAPGVQRLRHILATGGEKPYRQAKERLLSFTPACTLVRRDRDTPWCEKLVSVTGLVHYDLDHLADPAHLKALLSTNPHVVFAFISPRGDGLKIGVAATGICDAASYKTAWAFVLQQLKRDSPDTHFNEDPHVKYLHALCFVSHDPDLYFTPDAAPVVVPDARQTRRKVHRLPSSAPDADWITEALAAIPNHDADYDTWLRIGMALHSTGTTWGRALWDTWSQQSTKFDEAKQRHTWDSFTQDGAVTLGTLMYLAEQAGWRPPRTKVPWWTAGERATTRPTFATISAQEARPWHTW